MKGFYQLVPMLKFLGFNPAQIDRAKTALKKIQDNPHV